MRFGRRHCFGNLEQHTMKERKWNKASALFRACLAWCGTQPFRAAKRARRAHFIYSPAVFFSTREGIRNGTWVVCVNIEVHVTSINTVVEDNPRMRLKEIHKPKTKNIDQKNPKEGFFRKKCTNLQLLLPCWAVWHRTKSLHTLHRE